MPRDMRDIPRQNKTIEQRSRFMCRGLDQGCQSRCTTEIVLDQKEKDGSRPLLKYLQTTSPGSPGTRKNDWVCHGGNELVMALLMTLYCVGYSGLYRRLKIEETPRFLHGEESQPGDLCVGSIILGFRRQPTEHVLEQKFARLKAHLAVPNRAIRVSLSMRRGRYGCIEALSLATSSMSW